MKNQKTFDVVMLPTQKTFVKNQLILSTKENDKGNVLRKSISDYKDVDVEWRDKWVSQHLYFTSKNTIEIGDYYISHLSNQILQRTKKMDIVELLDRKIEASSDKGFTPKSWIPDSFVNAFIEHFNNRTLLKHVSLELNGVFNFGNHWDIKTRIDGSVIVHQAKMYSQAEVDDLLDRQAASTTAQILVNQGITYTQKEAEDVASKAWENGYWSHYEEINGDGSSHENPISVLNFIKNMRKK